jgi:hypothetical protein
MIVMMGDIIIFNIILLDSESYTTVASETFCERLLALIS